MITIGNHDAGVNSNAHHTFTHDETMPIYKLWFPQQVAETGGVYLNSKDRNSYLSHSIGDLTILSLDTGYMTSVTDQVDFIDKSLQGHKLSLASYHIPIYPSCEKDKKD